MKNFMNMKQAAEYLGCHTVTIARYCKQGRLTYYEIGTMKKFKQEDLDDFITGAKRNAKINSTAHPFTTR